MQKKRPGRDARTEPNPAGTPAEATPNYRVDRVFAPMPRPREASAVASQLLQRTRPRPTTSSPPINDADGELSLRRQLSRLQRQLAEAQRELANKDDELAAEVEKRLEAGRINEALLEQQRALQVRIDDLLGYEARTRGVEQRLQDSIAAADELAHAIEKEHERTAAAEARVDELTRAFDETRALWNAERTMLDERAKLAVADVEAKRKAAADAADDAYATAIARMKEKHDAELVELRAAHERSLQTLRGELEPKAVAAHSLAEERERLITEITALKNESARATAELEERRVRELAQAVETHATEQATLARTHAAELARTTLEKDEQIIALQQEVRSAEGREKALAETAEALRETQKKLQRELAEAKERCTVLEADKRTLEDRLIVVGENADKLLEEQRLLREQVEASASEVRRAAMDRMRFVSYLEEGLALLGALPPSEHNVEDEAVISIETAEPPTDS